jgi:uncharacterized protein
MKKLLTSALALTLLLPTFVLGQDAKPEGKDSQAKTARKLLLWKVTGKGTKKASYLFGTMHVPDKRVLDLPAEVDQAIKDADALYCELALEPSLQMQAMKHMMLPAGKTLPDIIGQDQVDRAAKLLATRGMPVNALLRLKPMIFISNVTQVVDYLPELQRGVQPLDAQLYNRAKQAGKEVGGLEQVEDQIAVFDSLSEAAQKKMVMSTLDGLEKAAKEGVRSTEPLVKTYLKGDLEAMLKVGEDQAMDEEGKAFMKKLNDDRNVTMTAEIKKHLTKNPGKAYFFAIGSLHYAGKKGIVALLKAEGYTVERVSAK